MTYPTPTAEAEAIEAMLQTDIAKRLGTYNHARIAAFKADALKRAAELRLLTYSQTNSQRKMTNTTSTACPEAKQHSFIYGRCLN